VCVCVCVCVVCVCVSIYATQDHPCLTHATQDHPCLTYATQKYPCLTYATQDHPCLTYTTQDHPCLTCAPASQYDHLLITTTFTTPRTHTRACARSLALTIYSSPPSPRTHAPSRSHCPSGGRHDGSKSSFSEKKPRSAMLSCSAAWLVAADEQQSRGLR
jgi:hypothetical protein